MALLSPICWALAVIFLRRTSASLPAFETNLFKNGVGLVLVPPTALLVHGVAGFDYLPAEIGVALLSGLVGVALADTLYLKALGLMGASRTGIVASLFSPFVILLSSVFLDESLARWQWLGLVLVLGGILLVTWRQNRQELTLEQVRTGTLVATAAVFMMAAGIVMVKEVLETRPLLWTASIRLAGGVAGMLIYVTVRQQWPALKQQFSRPQPWGGLFAGSLLASYLSTILWLGGYSLISASEASILNETASVWIVLFAWLILKEPVSWRRWLGLAIAFAGVAVMIWA